VSDAFSAFLIGAFAFARRVTDEAIISNVVRLTGKIARTVLSTLRLKLGR
jgi:hypothetical protein